MNILKLEKYQQPVFKIGDKVQLNSGGPEMTVFNIVGTIGAINNGYYAHGDVVCWWRDDEFILCCHAFHPAMLQYYK